MLLVLLAPALAPLEARAPAVGVRRGARRGGRCTPETLVSQTRGTSVCVRFLYLYLLLGVA